jgi:heptosyltransferase-2
VGRTDVGEAMGLTALCRAFVSNDSGAMHLSAAVGVHVTAIFGPTDERATSPLGPHTIVKHDVWCRPCHLRDCPIDHRCMTRIPVASVFASVKTALDQPVGGAPSS